MESSINNSYTSVGKTRSHFNHLLSQYPNNRFVGCAYLHFIMEIEGDPKKSAEWSEKVTHLHRSNLINTDKTNLLGFHAFSNLPPSVSDAATQQLVTTELESFATNDTENNSEDNTNNNKEK